MLGVQLKHERNIFLKMTANTTPVTHTVPGKPVILFFGISVGDTERVAADVNKLDLTVPKNTALSEYWCSINGNTISFDFPGYAGKQYGAIKFDVVYI